MNVQILNEIKELLLQSSYTLALLILVLSAVCVLIFILGRIVGRLELKSSYSKLIRDERSDAVKRSKAVLGGLAGEQLSPFLPDFPCNPADVRFVGKPLDFVGFPGAATGEPIEEVLFIEVKSGEAGLTKREREIRDCIQKGRVKFVEYRIPE